MDHTIRRLPDTELEVMQAIWDCVSPVTRAQIEEILQKTHPMAPTTLLTLLTRLAEKDFIMIEKHGRSSFYTPCITRHDYLSAQSHRFVSKLCSGSISAFAAALCDSGLTRDELDELRALLDRRSP